MEMVLYILVSLFILLGGCTQITSVEDHLATSNAELSSIIMKVGAFSIADLEAANADAKAHGDVVASMCYEAVIPLVQKAVATPLTAPIGLVSGFQEIRDGVNLAQSSKGFGIVKQLEVPCGPLAVDVGMNLAQLVKKFSGAAVPGLGLLP